MNTTGMLAPFAEEELHTFQGQGGKALTYIEDETVMDRLDIGYGLGNWAIQVEPFPYVEGVVKVRLGVRESGGEWIWYEDFGYPNNKGGQELKEAVSDGIRRCGRYVGIARDLYRKDTLPAHRAATPPSRPAPPQRPVTPARPHLVDEDILDPSDEDIAELHAAAPGTCPEHHVPWIGEGPADWYHRKPEGGYCRHPENKGRARAAR